jgi:hypothetical protein
MLYRYRTAFRYWRFRRATRHLDRTPPVALSATPQGEVHTMLGSRDVWMYLLASKSLVSWIPDVRVVVHSDGSLSEEHLTQIARHIPGVRFVRFDEADRRAAEALAGSPFLAKWRAVDAAYRRLLDVELWRTSERVVILDSDVLTNRKPTELIDWLKTGTRPFMLGQPPGEDHSAAPPREGEHVQAQFLRRVPEISARLAAPPLFVQGGTAGFCGYFREISLERIEKALQTALDLGLPMDQWGGDQCLVIYLLSIGGGERLPSDRYFNFEPSVRGKAANASVIHFYGTHRFDGGVYPELGARVVQRLLTGA